MTWMLFSVEDILHQIYLRERKRCQLLRVIAGM